MYLTCLWYIKDSTATGAQRLKRSMNRDVVREEPGARSCRVLKRFLNLILIPIENGKIRTFPLFFYSSDSQDINQKLSFRRYSLRIFEISDKSDFPFL